MLRGGFADHDGRTLESRRKHGYFVGVMIDDVATLFKLAGNQGRPDDWNDYFDPIGLILQIPPKREDYWCTPLNALTFARTGGDGTHYSLVSVSTSRRSDQVVVMTVPMSDTPNVIVGENLRDFLALGSRFGYFALEGLVHEPDETIAALRRRKYDEEWTAREIGMLKLIERTFRLKPWTDPRKRLAELERRFYAKLKLPPPI
jgi:hypothetical protein